MLDIKHIDDEEHKKLTGFTNKNILDMAEYLSEQGKDMWIRHVLVPGINDDEKYLKRLYEFISKLKTVKKISALINQQSLCAKFYHAMPFLSN